MHRLSLLAAATLLGLAGTAANAADWSDTSLGVRYGTHFAEPFDNNPDGSRVNVKKVIISLTHASGYKYGSNFFNVDLLSSDHTDPASGGGGAREAYVVYRNMLDIGKVSGKDFKMGPIRGYGITGGFDWNTKNDVGYSSKKQMLVLGPTVQFDVPGFANLSAFAFRESNAPVGHPQRFYYKTHGALELDWGIGIGSLPLSFNGYALWIASKGDNEFGGGTAPETHIDATLMYDVGLAAGLGKHVALIGVEYEYWRNKFGNPTTGNKGATASTPMIRAEYHF